MIDSTINWITMHPTIFWLGLYHAFIYITTSMEMPDTTSSKLYRFIFRLCNNIAANYSRSGASTTALGNLPPKIDAMPVAIPVTIKVPVTPVSVPISKTDDKS